MGNIRTINEFDALTLQKQNQHLDFITEFARSVLTQFYEKEESAASKALEIETWHSVLKFYGSEELKLAWEIERGVQVSEHGRLKYRVAPERIKSIIETERRKKDRIDAVRNPVVEVPIVRVTEEQKAAIVSDALTKNPNSKVLGQMAGKSTGRTRVKTMEPTTSKASLVASLRTELEQIEGSLSINEQIEALEAQLQLLKGDRQ